ncbi:hypothetical protein SAMN04488580_110189 [Mycobacterium sp. 283mftsu]|nr:hypothetical protein SAMN04488580_110189 [Mycobacterium sp. 283mftsu]
MSMGAHEGIGDHNGGKTGHVLEVGWTGKARR